MSILKRLFGGGGSKSEGGASPVAGTAVDYQGFTIIPEPIPEDGQFRLAARIEKEIGGETKSHRLVRADVLRDRDEAMDAAVRKAKQMIDEQGARLFG